jgi:hypothetical protein
MNEIIKAEIAKLREVADNLDNYAGLTDFGSSRRDLRDEAAAINAAADAIEKAMSASQ